MITLIGWAKPANAQQATFHALVNFESAEAATAFHNDVVLHVVITNQNGQIEYDEFVMVLDDIWGPEVVYVAYHSPNTQSRRWYVYGEADGGLLLEPELIWDGEAIDFDGDNLLNDVFECISDARR